MHRLLALAAAALCVLLAAPFVDTAWLVTAVSFAGVLGLTLEAEYRISGDSLDYTPTTALTAGTVIQLPDGRAAVPPNDIAAGQPGAVRVCGIFEVAKTSGVVVIDGAPLWWDHSANSATPVPPLVAGDRDFYLGVAQEDAASATTAVKVALNVRPAYEIDVHRDGGDTAVVLTAGSPYIYNRGGSMEAGFSATAEAQKLDWLSKRSFTVDSNPIVEGVIEVVINADEDVADLNVGMANATHASDADSITESCFIHLDMGGSLNILAESDDGTTEVAATDTTVDWAVGTPFHFAMDARDPSDVQIYVNGVLVLGGSTFDLSAATGPLKLLFHLEKSANDSPGVVHLDQLTMRHAQE